MDTNNPVPPAQLVSRPEAHQYTILLIDQVDVNRADTATNRKELKSTMKFISKVTCLDEMVVSKMNGYSRS